MSSTRRLCGALLLASFFATGLPSAVLGDQHPAHGREGDWSITKFLAPAWTFIRVIWEKEGSSIDPAGNPKPGVVLPPVSGDSTTQSSTSSPTATQ